jgi:hypothetical protein
MTHAHRDAADQATMRWTTPDAAPRRPSRQDAPSLRVTSGFPAGSRDAGAARPNDVDLGPQLEQLLERLAERLAQLLTPMLAANLPAALPEPVIPTQRLLSLDQLVALLPAGKRPATWKAWLYQHTRLGQVPGCHKIGNRLFFDPDLTLPWLLDGATPGRRRPGLDLPGNQSLHAGSMPHEPTHGPRSGESA